MKKLLLLIGGILSSLTFNAQVINYIEAGVLFSNEDISGTARFNAMSGAFGALGGDLSAADINPAGLAVFKNTEFSGTLGVNYNSTLTNFYGTSVQNKTNNLDMTQFGGVLVINGNRQSSNGKIAFGFNYSKTNDFDNSWFARGNSSFAPITDFYDPDAIYGIPNQQTFRNFTDGSNRKYAFTLASQVSDKIYIGASLVAYDLDFYQNTTTEELNEDSDGNTFDVRAQEDLLTLGSGISFNVGLIAKPSQEVRLGLAYQSPTWYNISESSIIFDDELYFNGQLEERPGPGSKSFFDYTLVTPSKFTGSFAYLFGKDGLISFDYTYKNYQNITLGPSSEFAVENQIFNDFLSPTNQYKVGAEWRIDYVSLRGGYSFEESPYKDAIDSDNITGYSFGIGLKLKGGLKLDLAYQNSSNTDVYDFLNVDGADPVELDINNDRFTATLVIAL